MKRILTILPMAVILVLASCSSRPKGVLSDGKMADLLADIFIAQSYMDAEYRGFASDSVRDGIILGVLKEHGVEEAEFDSTLSWYGRNMDLYRELFEKVDKNLAQRQHKIPGMEEMSDVFQNDFWPYARHTMITENSTTDNLSFSLPAALEKGDKIDWNFRVNRTAEGKLFMGVDYEDGSSSFITKSLYGDRKITISLQTDTVRKAKRIYGNYSVNSSAAMPVFIDSIVLRSVPYDSIVYFRVHSQKNYYGPRKKIVRTEEQKDTTESVGESEEADVPAAERTGSVLAGRKVRPVGAARVENRPGGENIRRVSDGAQGLVNTKR